MRKQTLWILLLGWIALLAFSALMVWITGDYHWGYAPVAPIVIILLLCGIM